MKKFTKIFLATIVLIGGLGMLVYALDWAASTGKEVGVQLQGGTPGAIPFIGPAGTLNQDYGASALNFQYTAAGGFTAPNLQFTSTSALAQSNTNIVLGVGWGVSATSSFSAGSTDSSGTLIIQALGSPAANPTIQFKFNNGPYGKSFPMFTWSGGVSTTFPQPPIFLTSSTTMATATVGMTPIVNATYLFNYLFTH